MPDYGLKVVNQNSEIQIDSFYRNYFFREGGSVTVSGLTVIDTTDTIVPPLSLLRPNTDRFVNVFSIDKSGDNYVSIRLVSEAGQSTTVEWKTYTPLTTYTGGMYGLLVYNPSGELVFNSDGKPFNIVSVHEVTLATPPTGIQDVSHGAVNPFYILTPRGYGVRSEEATGPPAAELYVKRAYTVGIKKLSSTSVRVGWFATTSWATTGQGGDFYNPTMQLLVCEPR